MTHQIHNRARFWLTLCALSFLLAATAKIGVSRGASADVLPLPINVPVPDTVFHTDNFAKSMAIDGDTLVVGAPWTKVNGAEQQGVVYIYTRDAADPTGFTLLKSIMGGTEHEEFGWSVAIHGDTLVVGAARSPDGAAYVFERNQGGTNNWGEVKKLMRGDTSTFTHYGRTVAIHGDTIAVAAPLGHGDVHIYQRNQGGDNQWGNTQLLNPGLPSNAQIKVAGFGDVLAFDGTRLIISAPRLGIKADDLPPGSPSLPDNFIGAVFVYTQGSGQFGLEAKFFSSDIDPATAFIHDDVYGVTLALNGDLLFVGATAGVSNGVSAGKVFVYQLNAGTAPAVGKPGPWGEVAQLSPSDGDGSSGPGVEGDEFASALYAVDDGIFVSSINAGVGKVYFYQNPSAAMAAKSGAPQAALDWGERYSFDATGGNSKFGIPIAGSDNTVVMADQAADGERGAIYAYSKDELFAADPNATPTPTETPLPGEPCLPEPQTETHRLHLPAIAGGVANLQDVTSSDATATNASPAQDEPLFLAPGCVVTGPGGVKVAAVEGAITQTVALTVEITAAPPEVLPEGVTPVGEFLRVSSAKSKHVDVETPFVIAVPVPSGVDSSHLMLVHLLPATQTLDSQISGYLWGYLPGVYDAASRLYLARMPFLLEEGTTFLMATHPDFETPVNQPPSTVRSAAVGVSGEFSVFCSNSTFRRPSDCSADLEVDAKLALDEIYLRMTDSNIFGFPRKMRLLDSGAQFIVSETFSVTASSASYAAYIQGPKDPHCAGAKGYYNRNTGFLALCAKAEHTFDALDKETLIHEFFHAVEHSYPEVLSDDFWDLDELWIMEGMAEAAVKSYSDVKMVRSTYYGVDNLQKVDQTLTTGIAGDNLVDEYLAQDFWVYVGASNFEGLGYLGPVLAAGGARLSGIDRALKDIYGKSLSDFYWGWVKNQTIENSLFVGESPGLICELTKEALITGTPVAFPAIEQVYPFDTPSAFDQLPPLTAKVIEVDFGSITGARFNVGYEGCTNLIDLDAREACNATARETIKMKLYLAGDTACADDAFEADDWLLTDLQPDERFFIVVANVQPDGNQGYFIGIE